MHATECTRAGTPVSTSAYTSLAAVVTRNTTVVSLSDVHLKAGVPDSESWCALAIALREELQARPVFDEVEVTADWVRVSLRHGSWHAPVTEELYEFIGQFDATADEEGEQDPEKLKALQAKASAGLLSFPLTWYEGDPPDYDGEDSAPSADGADHEKEAKAMRVDDDTWTRC